MKKKDGNPPRKRRRVMSPSGSSASAAAPTQLPSQVVGKKSADPFPLTIDSGVPGNPITILDSSDDSDGGASIPKVINNDIVSFGN